MRPPKQRAGMARRVAPAVAKAPARKPRAMAKQRVEPRLAEEPKPAPKRRAEGSTARPKVRIL